MHTLRLQIRHGHLFVLIEHDLFLLDTGAPESFSSTQSVTIAGQRFPLVSSYMGLTADILSGFVGVQTSGLLGADLLGTFDLIIDAPGSTVTFSTDELECDGDVVPLDSFMGIPILSAQIGSAAYRMFFDTGAQISYLQSDSLADYPPAGEVTDFYPGVGKFQTDTHIVDVQLGACSFTVRCGSLPGLLGMTPMMAGTQGILGNQILQGRRVGYFPRRRRLIL
jgi:hypothetical protein